MKILMILMLLVTSDLRASDWFCSEEATIRQGNEFLVCGVAIASDEPSAREESLNGAMAEFKKICDSSSDCKNHTVRTEPKRMECETRGDAYRCTRLISYTIGNPIVVAQQVAAKKDGLHQAQDEMNDRMNKVMIGGLRSQGFSEADIKKMVQESGF